MSYYGYPYNDPGDKGNLPEDGERLEFGVHQLPARDRTCPAWPTNANPFKPLRKQPSKTTILKGNPEIAARLARIKAGDQEVSREARIIINDSRPYAERMAEVERQKAELEAARDRWYAQAFAGA